MSHEYTALLCYGVSLTRAEADALSHLRGTTAAGQRGALTVLCQDFRNDEAGMGSMLVWAASSREAAWGTMDALPSAPSPAKWHAAVADAVADALPGGAVPSWPLPTWKLLVRSAPIGHPRAPLQ